MRHTRSFTAALALAAAAAPWLAACGSAGGSGSPDAGSSSAIDAAASTPADAGAADAAAWSPPPSPPACAAPSPGTPVTILGAPNRLLAPKLAWGGAEAGLAFVETAASGTWTVKVQRLTGAGALVGSAVEAGAFAAAVNGFPSLTIATDGASYLVCWAAPVVVGFPGIGCARVPVGSGAAAAAATFPDAGYPALAFGPGGFMLAYRDAMGFQAQPLGPTGAPVGSPHLVRPSASSGAGQSVAIAATASGYAVATAIATATPLLDRLTPAGAVTGSAVTVGGPNRAELASAGDLVGVSWVAANQEATAVLVSPDGSMTSPATLSSNAQSFGRVAIAAAGGKFGVTWSAMDGHIGYRALSATGAAEGIPVAVQQVGWDDNPHSLVAVSDGFLLATMVGMSADTLTIVQLGCL